MTTYCRVLLDTSAIVAIFQPNEQNHAACVDVLKTIITPMLTTWPVITEAHYLLRNDRHAQEALMELVADSAAVTLCSIELPFFDWYKQFVLRYHDHDIQLADASLVWLAGQRKTNLVFTLDRRDFSVFRIDDASMFQIFPEG